jgi:hypothetical protein
MLQLDRQALLILGLSLGGVGGRQGRDRTKVVTRPKASTQHTRAASICAVDLQQLHNNDE